MGADLILTYVAYPCYEDESSIDIVAYDQHKRQWYVTSEGLHVIDVLRSRIDELSIQDCLRFVEERQIELSDLLPEYLDDETFPTIRLHDGEQVATLHLGEVAEREPLSAEATTSVVDAVRIRLRAAVDYLWAEGQQPHRDCTVLAPQGRPFIFTGGMSWGDVPSDAYEHVLDLAVSQIQNAPIPKPTPED